MIERPRIGWLLFGACLLTACCKEEYLPSYPEDDSGDDAPTEDTDSDSGDAPTDPPRAAIDCEDVASVDMQDCSAEGIVGTWHLAEVCFDSDPSLLTGSDSVPECADTKIDYDWGFEATIIFSDDNRWSRESHSPPGAQIYSLSDACIEAISGGLDPAYLCELLDSVYEECVHEAGWCNCEFDASSFYPGGDESYPLSSAGTYTLEGTVLTTTTDETGETASGTFCTFGDTAYLLTEPNLEGVSAVMILEQM